MFLLICILVLSLNCFVVNVRSQSLNRLTGCALVTKSIDIDCGTGNAIQIYEGILGAKENPDGSCIYTPGDCYEYYEPYCNSGSQKCLIYAPKRKLNSCNKFSEYLEVKYYCVPTSSANIINVCDGQTITQQSGIIQSPGYPSYQQTNNICTTKITVPVGKTIDVFVSDMKIQNRDSSENCADFLRITDSSGTEDVCGSEKPIFAQSFCSNVIYISYKALTQASIFSFFKGFKLYYQMRDSSCGTGTPSQPVDTTTTTNTPTVDPSTLVLNASQFINFQICRSDQKQITAPDFNLVYIEQLEYRSQFISLFCLSPSSFDCSAPHPITCNLKRSCSFNLLSDYTIDECSGKRADYIYGVYRFIPIDSKIKSIVCDTPTVNGDLNPNGILLSKNYPNQNINAQCVTKLTSSNPNKVFRIYITDIYMEDDCSKSYVQFDDKKFPAISFCSSINPQKSYTYLGCSNQVEINYKTSNQNNNYRGFRIYYELVDAPATCQNSLTTTMTTAAPLTTPENNEILSQVLTSGGNAGGRPCKFPFKYQNNLNDECLPEGNTYWCSVTDDYDRDRLRGNCVPGFTTNQKFSVCDRDRRTFTCPKGYLINLISAQGSRTSDNSCNENKISCSQSLYNQITSIVGGKQSSLIVNSFTLTECSNARSNILTIDYNCIPETVAYVKSYEQCSSGQITEEKAIIFSPNYPTSQNNLNCNLNIVASTQKILNFYMVSSELQATFGSQECSESYIQLNNGEKICGNRKPGLITQKCGTNFQLNYYVGSRNYKGFKAYYELTNVIDPNQCIEPSTTNAPVSGSTTPAPPYVTQGIASGTITAVNCELSKTISCPNNYIISVKRAFYGRSSGNKCFYTNGDLISYSVQTLNCDGKRTCNLPFYFVLMPEHNAFATYLQVDYECIPTNLPSQNMCGMTFSNKNGIINTPSYPTYDQSLNCKASITTTSNNVIKAFIINLSISKDCSTDSIKFSEAASTVPRQFCGQIAGALAYESCGTKLDIDIVTRASPDNSFDGASIYFEAVPKPLDFVCNPPTTTVTTQKPTTTQPFSTVPTIPPFTGLASPVNTIIRCNSNYVNCPKDYVIIIRASFYGVKDSFTGCEYSPNDCFGPNTGATFSCSGRQSCYLSFFANSAQVPECQKRYANYLFLDYQCVPVKNAGNPPLPDNTEFCKPPTVVHKVNPDSSLILQSQNYPSYPTENIYCTKTITTNPGYALDVFFIAGSFPGKVDCNGSTDFLQITDGFTNHKLCGNPNQAKYLMESRSNTLQVTLNATSQILGFFYKGFQIYIQTVALPPVTGQPPTTTTPPTTSPIQIGFLSQEYYVDMCTLDSRILNCPNNYVIVVLEQSIVKSNDGCDFKPGDCREPTDLVSTECSGKQSCNIYFPFTPIPFCGGGNADGLEYIYQCVPSTPTSTIKAYSCSGRDIKIEGAKNGIIESPNYPNYELNIQCEISLIPAQNSYYKLYLIDIDLSDNVLDDTLAIDTLILGENEDGISRFVYSSNKSIELRYKSLIAANSSALESLRGFRIYFEAFTIGSETTKTTRLPITNKNDFTIIIESKKSNNLIYATLGVGLPCIILLIIAIAILNKASNVSNGNFEIKYSNKDGKLNNNITSFSNPTLE